MRSGVVNQGWLPFEYFLKNQTPPDCRRTDTAPAGSAREAYRCGRLSVYSQGIVRLLFERFHPALQIAEIPIQHFFRRLFIPGSEILPGVNLRQLCHADIHPQGNLFIAGAEEAPAACCACCTSRVHPFSRYRNFWQTAPRQPRQRTPPPRHTRRARPKTGCLQRA